MKKKIGFEVQESHKKGSGPFIYVNNIIQSKLSKEFSFIVFDYKNKPNGFSLNRVLYLKKQIQKSNVDIVNFGGLQLSGFHMILASKLAKKKTIVTVHGFSSDNININFFKKWILIFFDILTLSLSDRIIPVSNFVRNRRIIKPFHYKTTEVIYNLPTKNKEFKVKDFCIKKEENDIFITTVSRVTKEKGIATIIELSEIFRDNDNIKFLIVGEGDFKSEASKIIKGKKLDGKVIFLGFKENVYDVLQLSDIFLLPTLHETLSIATLEACKAKLPIVCSNTGGLVEIVKDNYNGFLVDKNSVSEFSKAITKLLDPSLRKNMGSNSLEIVETKFNEDKLLNKLNNIYNYL